jgi:hypothetical protein
MTRQELRSRVKDYEQGTLDPMEIIRFFNDVVDGGHIKDLSPIHQITARRIVKIR